MVQLICRDRYTKVVADFQTRNFVRECVAARPAGYQWMKKFKQGRWDGYISLMRKEYIPTGLANHVARKLERRGDEVQVIDQIGREAVQIAPYGVSGYEYRDYQVDAVETALEAGRGVLMMATNAGKTLILSGIIKATGCSAVVVVPTRPLLTQTADYFEQTLGMSIGRFGAGHQDLKDVTVTTVASLPKLVACDLAGNHTVLVDECHHVRSATIFDNIFKVPGPYRFGVSGTPITFDVLSDMKLIAATGDVIFTVSNADLIQDGWSVKPLVHIHVVDEPQVYDVDWHEEYRQCIVRNEVRNKMIADIAIKDAALGPVLVVVNWVEHANQIAEYLGDPSDHLKWELATGRDSEEVLRNKLDAMREGRLDVLIATPVFGEGIDIPSMASIVLAAGGKSHITLLQRIGRGLRTNEGKGVVHIHDFMDDTGDFVFAHSERRIALYKEEGFETTLG